MSSAPKVVDSDLPDPPYPAKTKIRGWRFQIDMERIRQSDTWALAPADMRPWLLMLWVTSWDQIPAGSYTDDDEIIAARIGMDYRIFQENRKFLMRGWVKHTDGRFYHEVIGEQVLGHIKYRETEAERKQLWRERDAERKRQEALRKGNVPRDGRGTPPDGHVSPVGVRTPEPIPEPEPINIRKKEDISCDLFDEFWAAYPKNAAKKACRAKWKSAKLDRIGTDLIADVLKRKAEDPQWLSGTKYIPNPLTYLNGERWNDEISKPTNGDRHATYQNAGDARRQSVSDALDADIRKIIQEENDERRRDADLDASRREDGEWAIFPIQGDLA